MYRETSSNYFGPNVYGSFERTDNIQISKISFYYSRHSAESVHKAIGSFRFQLLLIDSTWNFPFDLPKNERYIDSPTDWTLVSLNFKLNVYGITLVYDEIDSAHADMCFKSFTVPCSL